MQNLKDFLDEKVEQFNRPDFIPNDPISIPHRFSKKQDIEISGFFASILAWGQRKTIINKCLELFQLMDNAPHDFTLNHQESDLKPFFFEEKKDQSEYSQHKPTIQLEVKKPLTNESVDAYFEAG